MAWWRWRPGVCIAAGLVLRATNNSIPQRFGHACMVVGHACAWMEAWDKVVSRLQVEAPLPVVEPRKSTGSVPGRYRTGTSLNFVPLTGEAVWKRPSVQLGAEHMANVSDNQDAKSSRGRQAGAGCWGRNVGASGA